MNKFGSRKFLVMILTNFVFVGLFAFTLLFGEARSLDLISNTLILSIGFFNAAYIGGNVLDAFIKNKYWRGGESKDDGK